MVNRFLRKLKILWWPVLTTSNKAKTIQPEADSMSGDEVNEVKVSLFAPGGNVSASAVNSVYEGNPLSDKSHKSIAVVCACIMREGAQEILLSMRTAPGVAGLHGKWELPGGKIEFGETPEQTIVREIREELGLDIIPRRLLPYLHTNLWEYEHSVQHVVLACYECDLEGNASPGAETPETRWFHINQIDFETTLPGTREFVSLAAHNDWFDKVYIEFECIDSSTKISKRFAVATQSTLFSKYGLVKYWGRIGANPRMKREEFASSRELDEQIFETAKRRLVEGYYIRALNGPDRRPEVLTRIVEFAKQRDEYRSAS